MKNIILIILLLVSATCSQAQDTKNSVMVRGGLSTNNCHDSVTEWRILDASRKHAINTYIKDPYTYSSWLICANPKGDKTELWQTQLMCNTADGVVYIRDKWVVNPSKPCHIDTHLITIPALGNITYLNNVIEL